MHVYAVVYESHRQHYNKTVHALFFNKLRAIEYRAAVQDYYYPHRIYEGGELKPVLNGPKWEPHTGSTLGPHTMVRSFSDGYEIVYIRKVDIMDGEGGELPGENKLPNCDVTLQI